MNHPNMPLSVPDMIHPTAIIDPRAEVDPTVQVGPCAVIDTGVRVGPGCVLGPHVYLTGQTVIGARNRFHAGCVIGDAPQDLKYGGEPTGLVIGEDNVFREHVTVHRSNTPEEVTRIGSHCFFMASSHVGHNSVVGNRVIMANGALLGGHVEVHDQAFLSGHCLVHQFVRIGRLALMQGRSGVGLDLPPYTVARGVNQLCGLNIVGLRRAGLSAEERLDLKSAYKTLFRAGHRIEEALKWARQGAKFEHARAMIEFVAASKRGVVRDAGSREDRHD